MMDQIPRKIIVDEHNRPVAVQIDYATWLAIEHEISCLATLAPKVSDPSGFAGTIRLTIDPLEYQSEIRSEWK